MALPLDPAALEVQNPERSSSNKFPRAPTRGHELTRIRGLILHFCSNRATISKKTETSRRFYALRSTKLKNFGTKNSATRLHAPPEESEIRSPSSRAHTRHHTLHALTRAGSFSSADALHDVMGDVIIKQPVDPFVQIRPGSASLTRIRSA